MKIFSIRFGATPALVTASLAACTTSQPPVNTLCGGIQIEQGGRAVESDGLSVTIMRAPFVIQKGVAAQEPFRLHASERYPLGIFRSVAKKELWLVDSNALQRAPGDLRLAGHNIRLDWPGSVGSSYDAGVDLNMPKLLQRPAGIPRERAFIGRMDYNQAAPVGNTDKQRIAVDSIHGQPIATTRWPSLYLTVLRDAGGSVSNARKVAFTECSVYFR